MSIIITLQSWHICAPQGYILIRLLFTIYANDQCCTYQGHWLFEYANDTMSSVDIPMMISGAAKYNG